MVKFLSYLVFIAALVSISYVLSGAGQFLPETVGYEDFSKDDHYTYGLQKHYMTLFRRISNRQIEFDDFGDVALETPQYRAVIRRKSVQKGVWVQYNVKLYYHIKYAMQRPVVVESVFIDATPKEKRARVKDFFWEIR